MPRGANREAYKAEENVKQSSKQRAPNCVRLTPDDCQEGPRRAAGDPPAMLPVFQSSLQAE
jgi:hypothetical protein